MLFIFIGETLTNEVNHFYIPYIASTIKLPI